MSFLLQETGDRLLQEIGDDILLDEAALVGVWIDGVDYTDLVQYASFALTEAANRGEVGTGGFDVVDTLNALDIPALKTVTYDESAVVGDTRVYTGFTHARTEDALKGSGTAKMWGVETTDLNILASDYILSTGADRGSETDYARVTWLLTTVFGSTGSISAGVVPNSNTVTMEAQDYRGRKPADVLAECSEATGKLWFVYDYGAGRKLYYDVATGTSLSSTAQISDVGDGDFAPFEVRVTKNPDRIYSKVHLTYNGGVVTASDAAVATAYRAREAHVLDSSISGATLAQAKADALLAGAAAELVEVEGLTIDVPIANVNDIRQGQRVEIKLTRHGIDAFTYFRVIRRTIVPLGQTHYRLSLGLASDVLAAANGGRGSDDIWPNKSNANDDGATVIVDRGGITVTDGAITVTNGDDIVIIDGSSDMFRIAATGTLADTVSTGTNGQVTATLTALGTSLSEPMTVLSTIGFSITSEANAAAVNTSKSLAFGPTAFQYDNDSYVAASSGGAVTQRAVTYPAYAGGASSLSATPTGTMRARLESANNAGVTFYFHMRYYVLEQVAI
jgi:hypothetical protein